MQDEKKDGSDARHGFAALASNFADIIIKFSGSDKTYSSSKWAQDIDDNADIFGWTAQQKLIVARRSLTGTAELWLRSEKAFKTYEELKTALLKEFPDALNSKEMHELMGSRKKRRDETYYEYMLVMKELGKRAKFPDYVSIQYIVDGIPDTEINKCILYGVTTYPVLKEKLSIYETMKNKSRSANSVSGNLKKKQDDVKRCYKCGSLSHISSSCSNGVKCFKFDEYCQIEGIQHITITTGVPRGNGQVERIHRILISVLTKLCLGDEKQWYRHVSQVQRAINSTFQRSIGTTPFELLIGVKMKIKEDVELIRLLHEEDREEFVKEREDLRERAKVQILRVQEENRKSYNKKRKEGVKYNVGEFVAIKRTQFGKTLKIRAKYLGPYRVVKLLGKDRYEVEKADGAAEGPWRTSTSADYMKGWPVSIEY